MKHILSSAVVMAVVLASSVEAATRTWAGGSGNWTNPAMWVGGVAPSPGDDLVFPGPGSGTMINDFPAGTPFRSINVSSGPTIGGWILDGNPIVLGEGGFSANPTMQVGLAIALSANQSWTFNSYAALRVPLELNGHALVITANGYLEWWGGTGSGSLTINGNGDLNAIHTTTTTFPLTLDDIQATLQHPYPGPVTVTGNEVLTLINCATYGPLTMNGGILVVFNCGTSADFTMGPGAVFRVPISNSTALDVNGTVTLGGAALNVVTSGPFGVPGEVTVLIVNDGVDPVQGTFAGLPEGSLITSNGRRFAISYRGGDGNDVVLVELPPPATTFTVTNLNDSGPGSLRQAVLDANATAGFDTITFQSGLAGTITLTGGEIAISDSVRIFGPHGGGITVSGNDTSRIFSADTSEVTIANLTLTRGRAAQGGAIDARLNQLVLSGMTLSENTALTGDGGALRIGIGSAPSPGGRLETLVIRDSTITGNSALNGYGGGIWYRGAAGQMDHVTLTNNGAANSGGGMYAEVYPRFTFGQLAMRFALVTGNESCRLPQTTACGGAGLSVHTTDLVESKTSFLLDASSINNNNAHPENGGSGGGVRCVSSSGAMFVGCSLLRSAIWGNNAFHGGGIYAEYASLGLSHSTVVSNTGYGNGGGVYVATSAGLANVTMTGNRAVGEGGGLYAAGWPYGDIANSIVADNTSDASPAGTPDVGTAAGVTVPVEYSLIRTPGTASIGVKAGYVTGVDPLLGPLQVDPGSPTPTRDPLAGSPVINAGDPAFTATSDDVYDQRFYPRIAGGRVDMGAVEVQAAPTSADVSVDKTVNGTVFARRPASYDITVANAGPAIANDVTLTDTLPAGARILDVHTSQGTCAFASTTTTCNLGSIVAGVSATVTVHFIIDAPGTYQTTASATTSSTDSNSANNARTTAVTVQPVAGEAPRHDLSITQAVSRATPVAGQPLFFILTVSNAGPDAASNVVVTDRLPSNATFVDATASQGTCIHDVRGDVICSLGTLAGGQSATVTIQVIPEAGSITNGAMVNSTATGGFGDPAFANNVTTTTVAASEHASDIPTTSEWAKILLAAAMTLAGWLALRRS